MGSKTMHTRVRGVLWKPTAVELVSNATEARQRVGLALALTS